MATDLGRRTARKTLLAVAGLVSVHDAIWTTDRATAARRWSEVHPDMAAGLAELLAWATDERQADRPRLVEQLATTVARVARQFDESIGLW